ncbi:MULTISPECIES: hypothetical protein [unclassified Thioalkalivibrio]|nr:MULTISPECIES: hypothetical protein [unclassified Thioalkalivibrio]
MDQYTPDRLVQDDAVPEADLAPLPMPDASGWPEPGSMAAFVDRPLFSPSRRPPVDEPEEGESEEDAAEEDEDAPLAIQLRSVVMTPDDEHIWVQREEEERLHRLRVGDEFEGWVLESLDAGAAEFSSEDKTQRVPLRPQRSRSLGIDRVPLGQPAPPLP